MHPVSAHIVQLFTQYADASRAEPMARYMRDQFHFFGIAATQRRNLQQEDKRAYARLDRLEKDQVLGELWQQPHRECQYAAMDWLVAEAKKLPLGYHEQFERLITVKSWWDTVDYIVVKGCGPYFSQHPELIEWITKQWMDSGNIWLQRSAILFQLNYKSKTNVPLLHEYILKLKDSKEFFLQKAMGWALRQYAKTDPMGVRLFVDSHSLPSLTRREALKHII